MINSLEKNLVPKMEAEFLVLVDVIQKPSFLISSSSSNRPQQQFDTHFMEHLIRHAKYLLENSSKSFDMCIKLVQIFRQMLSLNDVQIQDKQVIDYYNRVF
jgi:hypothetical protein